MNLVRASGMFGRGGFEARAIGTANRDESGTKLVVVVDVVIGAVGVVVVFVVVGVDIHQLQRLLLLAELEHR